MKLLLPLLAISAVSLVSCGPPEGGNRVAPGTTTKDGTNTAGSGVAEDSQTPPSTSTGFKGTGAGVDRPDAPTSPPAQPLPNEQPK